MNTSFRLPLSFGRLVESIDLADLTNESLQQMIIIRRGRPSVSSPALFKKPQYRHHQGGRWPTDMTMRYYDIVDPLKTSLYVAFAPLIDADRQDQFITYLAQELILLTKHGIFDMSGAFLTRVPQKTLKSKLRERFFNHAKVMRATGVMDGHEAYNFSFTEFTSGKYLLSTSDIISFNLLIRYKRGHK